MTKKLAASFSSCSACTKMISSVNGGGKARRGGRGFQEAVVISPVSGSAAAVASFCRSRVTPPPRLRLFESVALAVQLQNMVMMREAIEKRAGETLAAENSGPLLKGKSRVRDAG